MPQPYAEVLVKGTLLSLLFGISLQAAEVRPPGTVLAWGAIAPPPLITNAIAVSTKGGGNGGAHGLALLNDSTVKGWGNNLYGQAVPPPDLTNAISVAAGAMHSVAARADGTVVCWGRNYVGESSPPPDLTNVTAVAAGFIHSVALLADGTVRTWGDSGGTPTNANIVAIAGGYDHTLGLLSDGTVIGWGTVNQWGQATVPSGLSNVAVIAAGRMHSVAILSNGTVVAWGNLGVAPSNLSNVVAIAAGMNHGIAYRPTESLIGWGFNFNGALNIPVQYTNFTCLAAGNDISIVVTPQPVILTQPVSFTIPAGRNRSLSVQASGSTPVTYQWLFDGTPLSGATNNLLAFTNIQEANEGNYNVAISNAGGSITSIVASVTVQASAPTISTNLSNRTVVAGTNIVLRIDAVGSEPLFYQWSFNDGRLEEATNTTLLLTNVTEGQEGTYQVVVSNAYGSATSTLITLTVNEPPVITNDPAEISLFAGTNVILRSSAGGNLPISYQWRFQGMNLAGATNSSLVLTNLQSLNAGEYALVASNAFGVVTNTLYSLVIVDSPPIILEQPVSQNFTIGGTVSLRALAYGSSPMTNQWWHNGISINGATNSWLALSALETNAIGEYFVTFSNSFGAATSLVAVLSLGDPFPGEVDWPTLTFSAIVTNVFISPTCITHAGDDTRRIFIVEQSGRIRIVQGSNALGVPFLDIAARVKSGAEQGLLGLAFAPGFRTNGHFYIDYTRQPDGATVISRFLMSANGDLADTNSEQIIKVIPQPFANHNGGQLAFGPDGFLYVGMGDGGFSFTADPFFNGQNTNSLLGKILRLDVEGGVTPYSIPTNNPFVGNTNYAPEIWAFGLRNPWRFSFDRVLGDLYIGDVGHQRFEEIDFQPANSPGGENYGWSLFEGPAAFSLLPAGFDVSPFTFPATWYGHNLGASVTGGYVYRGPNEPRLNGVYFFGDFVSKRIWGLIRLGTNWQRQELVRTTFAISTFGEDEEGRLYLADYSNGKIYRIEDNRLASPPQFSPAGGTFTSEQDVAAIIATPGARIHFTTDGRDPVEADPSITNGQIIRMAASGILKARAYRNDLLPSTVTAATFNFQVSPPAFTPAQGPITNGTLITVTSATPAAIIYYTTNGSQPDTTSYPYQEPIPLAGNKTLRARAFKAGFTVSPITTAFFSLEKVAAPTFEPIQGPITNGTPLTITSTTPGATIYFTVDGSAPSTNSIVYVGPIPLNGETTLSARAFRDDLADSDVRTTFFPLAYVAAPVLSPSSGPVTNGQVVSISCATPDANVRYTLDGSQPTLGSLQSTGAVVITGNQTLTVRAYKPGHGDSPVTAVRYNLWSPEATVVTTLAGSGDSGFVDGERHGARFNFPHALCVDATGNVYVADLGNHAIRRIATNGIVTTLAGSGSPGFQNGTSTNAQFNQPVGICFGPGGDLYVSDRENRRIRRVTLNGTVTTFCGSGATGNGDGPANTATFSFLTHISYAHGSLYVGSSGLIRKVDANGVASTLPYGTVYDPSAVLDENTNAFIVSSFIYVDRFSPQLGTEVYAGSTPPGFADGPRLTSKFPQYPDVARCITRDAQGNLYISDPAWVRKVATNGWVSTLAGTQVGGYADGAGRLSQFYYPAGLAVDAQSSVYVADALNNRIRKIWTDSDQDLIPDVLETVGSGYVLGVDDRAIDSDGDGMSNSEEYLAGTSPSSPQSYVALESPILQTNGIVRLEWRSIPGRRYVLRYSDDLQTWQSLGNPIFGTGSILTITDPELVSGHSRRIYRLFVTQF